MEVRGDVAREKKKVRDRPGCIYLRKMRSGKGSTWPVMMLPPLKTMRGGSAAKGNQKGSGLGGGKRILKRKKAVFLSKHEMNQEGGE